MKDAQCAETYGEKNADIYDSYFLSYGQNPRIVWKNGPTFFLSEKMRNYLERI